MKKYILYLILCFIVSFMSSCTSVYENRDTSIPEGMERLTFEVIVPSSKVVSSDTRSITSDKENKIENLYVKIGNYNDDHINNFYSTQKGTIIFDSNARQDSIYSASIEVPAGTFRAGDAIYVWANQEYPADVTSEEGLTTPLFMSGTGTISNKGGNLFEADVHLLRGVAKLRTVVRTTKRSVMGSWNIKMSEVETQLLRMPSAIRPFAPFDSHRNPAVNASWNVYNNNKVNYVDCSSRTPDWWSQTGNSHLLSSIELPIDDGVNTGKVTETSYDRYIYENWLENELSGYNENTNVTALKVRIPLLNNETGENRIVERTIPIKTNGSYRILRNHIYTLDIRVLSVDDIELNLYLQNWWSEVNVNGDIPGEAFSVDKSVVPMITHVADPAPAFTITAKGRLGSTLEVCLVDSSMAEVPQSKGISLWHKTNDGALTKVADDNHIRYDFLSDTESVKMQVAFTTTTYNGTEGGFFKVSCGNATVRYIPIRAVNEYHRVDEDKMIKATTSNCYIVENGGGYVFNASVMGNGEVGIYPNVQALNKAYNAYGDMNPQSASIAPKSAKLLWQDVDGLVTQVGLSMNATTSAAEVIFHVSGLRAGNAVISVYDKPDPNDPAAKVLWNWHIWCAPRPGMLYTKGSASSDEGGKRIYAFMDRNLGATTADETSDTSQGLLYRFGRNVPLIHFNRASIFDVLGTNITGQIQQGDGTAGGDTGQVWDNIRFPLRYFTGWESNYDAGMWGENGIADYYDKKTIYDPCPPGYKVPGYQAFQALKELYYPYNFLQENSGIYFTGLRGGTLCFPWVDYFEGKNNEDGKWSTGKRMSYYSAHVKSVNGSQSLKAGEAYGLICKWGEEPMLSGEYIMMTDIVPVRCISEK